jgi:hypothetical protein
MDTSVHIATVAALRERIQCLEGGATHRRAVLPFGIKAIDERLPGGRSRPNLRKCEGKSIYCKYKNRA